MTSENTMKDRWEQLGLPPMELAESSENNRVNSGLYKCLLPSLHKLILLLLLTTFGVGTYVLLLKLSESNDYASNTEIIILTGNNDLPNMTVHNMEIFMRIKNETVDQKLKSEPKFKRKKRHTDASATSSTDMEDIINMTEDQIEKARELILKHDVLCKNENKQEICKDFVSKLKKIVQNDDKTKENPTRTKLKDHHNDVHIKATPIEVSPTDLTKREALPITNVGNVLESIPGIHFETRDASPYTNAKGLPHSHSFSPHHLPETCLLARLLKQNYPNAKGIYDPSPEYLGPHYEHALLPQSRYYSPAIPAPYLQERDIGMQRHKIHPQDVDIFMSLLTSKSQPTATERASNTSREVTCPPGTISCLDGETCIDEKQWCDGNVDCVDVSDEARCNCKSRVDKSRLCDGYFDCPFGEDEMGCYGCNETMFSCEDLDMNSQSTCFTKEQRCNNVVDCPNHKDEVECNMLAPSLLKKPLFAISNTEGFLHRNFKGDWFAVCKNPYMWAHDACRRETGLIIRPPLIHIVPIDPMMKVDYLNTGPGGLIQASDTCMNSSAVYVECPDMLCGTRVQSTSQLLKENAAIENRLFGRNKRFLLKNHPYPVMFYGNRLKRDIDGTRTNYEIKFDTSKTDVSDASRNKRTESRVVGGKPSQPAAWPWMVAVYRNGMFHCGGVIITRSWVVSAAHCVHKYWDHYYEVQVGMLRRFSFSPQEQSHKVTHVIVNPQYSQSDMKNDLSLLKVEPAIQFSRWVRPICLPRPDTAGPDWLWGPAPGTICTSVGWGATTEHGPDPDHMREVEVPIWANCKHREDRAGNEICAGLVEGGRDTCQGDSGGPLLCRNPFNPQQWYMAGIVSHGDGCARKDEPGVYTRVSLFVKWIKYHISSKTLPKFQPLQVCPGFKCETGISKCLPNKRKCDKIVDCLDGEDETKCQFTRTVSTIFLDPKSSSEEELESKEVQTDSTLTSSGDTNLEDTTTAKIYLAGGTTKPTDAINTSDSTLKPQSKKETDVEKEDYKHEDHSNSGSQSKESADSEKSEIIEHEKHPIDQSLPKESSNEKKTDFVNQESPFNDLHSKESKDATKLVSENEENSSAHAESRESSNSKILDLENQESSDNHVLSKEPTDIKKLDFEHASTLEIINDDSSYNFKSSEETATSDPIKESITEVASPSHGDTDIFTVDFSGKPLESESSKLERILDTTTLAPPTEPDKISTGFIEERPTEKEFENKLETSTSAFAHSDLVDPINKEKTTPTPNLVEDNLNNKAENKSGLVIELFPSSQSTESGHEDIDVTDLNNDSGVTVNHHHHDHTSAEKLPDNSNKLDQIEDNIFSELEPAKIRRKHRIPNEFECRRIEQRIPYHQRCDRKADCEDGTDEFDCTCTDFLFTFNEKLICDGVIDCADGHDESDCFNCPEEHFLCKQSQICLPEKYVCDGKSQCPYGEDELNCYALSNGKEMEFDLDERPVVKLEGYLTQKHFKDWHIVCDDKLTLERQEEAAIHICRYLGFSSANNYHVKYINVKEDEITKRSLDNKRNRRDTMERVPVHFAYRQESEEHDRHVIIKEPQVIKEQCVPNITKTCKSLYVFCDNSLFTNFEDSENMLMRETELASNHTWPWIAKVFVEGDYRCTGVLVNLSWVLVSDSCLWDSTLTHHYITVVLGSHRTLGGMNGVHEQVYQVDSKKDVYRSRASLLHLRKPAHYSNAVKPMVVSSSYSLEQKSTCVAVGQDNNNNTISVFLEETSENCHRSNRCFKRKSSNKICPPGMTSHRHWAGIVSCHTDQGWYPAATFVDGRGECGLEDHINATDIENLKNEIKHRYGNKTLPSLIDEVYGDDCPGVRCSRGRCVPLLLVCNGVKDCEDGKDETEEACLNKHNMCDKDPYHKGCECSVGQMKCRNGKCISKELFRDGNNDCRDGTDEPGQTVCKDYLATVMPSRLCDGVLHCHDRSDEDPVYCKCFAKKYFKCGSKSGVDHCVAPDTVCDGVRDCPNGEDEQTCMALTAPHGTPYGTGQVIVRSHGVWHSKCYATKNHTKSELEAICSELGFVSGHAKQIIGNKKFVEHPYNKLEIDSFNEIVLNNNTIIKMRNTHEPLARAVFDEELENCYPVFIECR